MTKRFSGLLLPLFLLITIPSLKGQNDVVRSYLDKTGEYAEIYNGRVEIIYPSILYKNQPYYKSSDFTGGKLMHNGNTYSNVSLRLDLYKEQLILRSPGSNYHIIAANECVDSVYLYDDVFVYLTQYDKTTPKAGYYRLLHDGNLQLLHKISFSLDTRDVVYRFSSQDKYHVLFNGKYREVKNKNSIIDILPQYKKQINQFAKEYKLDFSLNKEYSLMRLISYCEQLVSGNEPAKRKVYSASLPKLPQIQDAHQDSASVAGVTPYNVYGHSFDVSDVISLDTTFTLSSKTVPVDHPQETGFYETGIGFTDSENKTYVIGDPFTETTAPVVQLKGKIVNSKTKEPLIGVSIVLKGTNEGAVTDANGNYVLNLAPGQHQLQISGFEIKNARRQVMVHSSGTFDIGIIEEIRELDEVTIFGGRINQVKNTNIGLERIQVEKIKNIPMVLGEADILRALQTLPGVKTVGEASTGFNVRGGATDQNLILMNDNTLYNPNHLFGFFTAFSADMVSEAEIYKSSIPARYGGRISSVLNVTGKEASMEKFSGKLGLGLVTSNLTLETPIAKEKSSLLLTGRTTYSDWILKQLPEKSGYNEGSAGFYDLGIVFTQKIDDKNKLNVYGYYSSDRFSFSANEEYRYKNMNVSASWRTLIGEKLTAYFSAGYDHYDYMNHQYYPEFSAYKLGFDIDQFFGKADFSYFQNNHKIDFGIKSTLYNLNAGIYEPENVNSIIQPDKLQTEKALESGIYISDQWNVSPKWSIDAGIRYSMYNALGPKNYYTYNPGTLPDESTMWDTVSVASGKVFQTYHGPEFRLAARYLLSDRISLKAGYNTMRQYIHKISNTLVMSPTDTWKLSDTNIKPQRGWQAASGIFFNAPSLEWEASLEVYYKKMYDYLDYRSGARLIMNHHIETDVLNTEGHAYGAELSLRKTMGRLTGWASYTYSRTFLRQNDKLISNPVNNGDWYPTDYDKPHDIKFVGNFRLTQRYSLSLNLDYSTGRPTTIPTSKYYDEETKSYQLVYTNRNDYRIPDYFRTDISFNIEPHHKLTLLTHSTINIGVYNVTGRKNVYNVYYLSENGQTKGYQLSIFGTPIPFITYNIKF